MSTNPVLDRYEAELPFEGVRAPIVVTEPQIYLFVITIVAVDHPGHRHDGIGINTRCLSEFRVVRHGAHCLA